MKTPAPRRSPASFGAFAPFRHRGLGARNLALFAVALAGWTAAAPSSARAQDTGAVAPVYAFTPDPNSGNNDIPFGGLVKAADGNFYGLSQRRDTYGELYRLTPSGQVTIVYYFQGGSGGLYPSNLILGNDGNLYGLASGGPTNDGLLFRLTLQGVLTVVHDFNAYVDGSSPSSLVQAKDGTFYGTTRTGGYTTAGGGNSGYGTVYSVTPAGNAAVLHTFTGNGSDLRPSASALGSDGNLYGVASSVFFRITPAGVYTPLGSIPIGSSLLPPNSLLLANDGNFYGTTPDQNAIHIYTNGSVFRITPQGVYTNLHTFGGRDGIGTSALVQASDGNLYGVTRTGGLNTPGIYYGPGDGYGTAYQITLQGVFTNLYSFTRTSSDGANPSGPLLEIGPGVFYGTSSGSTSGYVFQLKIVHHPGFFAGQTPLNNSTFYLSFANNNYFGYYSYLTDPTYIYHFDLGYEYLVDANDGQGDLYLYDFASGGYFYTGPNFPFPYMYDFNLKSIVYYFPDPDNAGRYNFYGSRYFYDFATRQIVIK